MSTYINIKIVGDWQIKTRKTSLERMTSCLALFSTVTQLGVRQSSAVMFRYETVTLFSYISYMQSINIFKHISWRFYSNTVNRPYDQRLNWRTDPKVSLPVFLTPLVLTNANCLRANLLPLLRNWPLLGSGAVVQTIQNETVSFNA